MKAQLEIFGRIDKGILLLYLVLAGIGWLSVFSSEYAGGPIFDLATSYGKQLLFLGSALLIGTAVLLLDVRFFTSFAWIIYAIFMMLLVAVLFLGVEINATKAWFRFGSLALQPSELAKYATALALAAYASKQRMNNPDLKMRIKAFAIVIMPAMLVLLQKDVGTTLVFSSFALVLYREGYISGLVLFFAGLAILLFVLTLLFNEFVIIGGLALIALTIIFFTRKKAGIIPQLLGLFLLFSLYVYSVDFAFEQVLQPHHKARIEVIVYGSSDLQGAGYNLHQSKIAIGSGGLWGKGFRQGTQTQFNFIPEQSTDFIFCTIGEEWGFVGSLVIISLFVSLLLRLIYVAERQKSIFSRIMGYSTASILFFHFTINIGMTVGLAPVIGIPLPLISYGGSSLWGTSLLLFTFLKLDARRKEMP